MSLDSGLKIHVCIELLLISTVIHNNTWWLCGFQCFVEVCKVLSVFSGSGYIVNFYHTFDYMLSNEYNTCILCTFLCSVYI